MVEPRRILDLEWDERKLGRQLDLEMKLQTRQMPLDRLDDKTDLARVGIVEVHRKAGQLLFAQLGEIDEDAGPEVRGAKSRGGDHA